jgi:hypothetical protein
MTSGKTEVPAPPSIAATDAPPLTAAGEPPAFDRLTGSELGRLTLGFYLVFWGALVVLSAMCEFFTAFAVRFLAGVILGGGCVALTFGAWRLHQVKSLGDSWRRRTREALIASALLIYLCPFFLMWRQVPMNLYLLGHALAMLAALCYSLTLNCQIVAALGRATGKRSLVTQSVLFGTIAVVMLFPPFALFAQVTILAVRSGRDPLSLVQFWLERTQSWIVLLLLVPFALTLSLVWAAKDLALHRLLDRHADEPTAP